MPLSHLPLFLTSAFAGLAHWLQKRSAARLPVLNIGILFARGRRTVTSWFRAAGIDEDFRPAYTTVCAVGRETNHLAISALEAALPLLGPRRLRVAKGDTPTPRYGPCARGAGIHHNPTPGPAGAKHLHGHVWVTLAALAKHPDWGTLALPLQAQLYLRRANLDEVPPERHRVFRTKLEMAAEQLDWLKTWADDRFEEIWAMVDGAYAKRPVLRRARERGITVVSRLRKDAALWSLPKQVPPEQRGPSRSPERRPPTYGKKRISLARRAAHQGGWQEVECVQYGAQVVKTMKTFLATYRPAGGMIRDPSGARLVKEEDDWLPYFSINPEATPQEVLEGMADRGSEEGTFKDVKEVWGAGQQQVRNVDSNEGCFNLNLWMYSLVEAWAWDKPAEELVDRSASPWDSEPRRPSHADKRKALQRVILRGKIEEALAGRPSKEKIRALVECLLDLAA